MKKLLSLLSVLTIGGTAVPTTIAARPYQKEKNINYLNLLEDLSRIKRQVVIQIEPDDISVVINPNRWGSNFLIKIKSAACKTIMATTTYLLTPIINNFIESISNSAANLASTYVQNNLWTNETYTSSAISGLAYGSAYDIVKNVFESFKKMLNLWKNNPQSLKNIVKNNNGESEGVSIAVQTNTYGPTIIRVGSYDSDGLHDEN